MTIPHLPDVVRPSHQAASNPPEPDTDDVTAFMKADGTAFIGVGETADELMINEAWICDERGAVNLDDWQ